MSFVARTTRFTRGKLPHWEIENGRYFVTVRCHDSLPANVVARLAEIHATLQSIEPQSDQFSALQRRYFQTMEKYLDAGHGEAWLTSPKIAAILIQEIAALESSGVAAPHFTLMPNHWHALLVPGPDCQLSLSQIMRALKGRSARRINLALQRSGTFWQREWFDRWMRDDDESDRTVAYIRQNPVKAGLAPTWQHHPWTK